MSTGVRERAELIFLEVADLHPRRWDEEVRARCAGDAALEREVRSLLDCHEEAGGFLDAAELGHARPAGAFATDEAELAPGTRLGEYVVQRLLGKGGMGHVYVAEQDKPRRTVALKVIRRGFGTAGLVRRFEHEAEVLGRLQHPGIAHIHEAGSALREDGTPQPFIAMELVDGPPLNVYADEHKLGASERMELAAKVCDAVHHAHQRGVIHRDLKPANILVDERGQPKILDFGVARASDSDLRVTTLQTSVGQLIGTLPYMSPEQVLGNPMEVDTRSDVYALGVVLYQLLTGRLPLDVSSRSLPEAARVIREESPTRLGRVSRTLRGDVETIVAKALDKDKARRYQSAAELADDLRRAVAGEPILAKQDSAMYVLRKQFRRHRVAFGFAVAAMAGVLAFAVYATVSAARERKLAAAATGALAAAKREAERASDAGTRLAVELARSNIERGRLQAILGSLPIAEQTLWPEHLRDPDSPEARWALWELYERLPCRWTVQGSPRTEEATVSPDGSLLALVTTEGAIALRNAAEPSRDVRTVGELGSRPSAVAMSADASFLVVGLASGPVVRVDLGRGTHVSLGDPHVRGTAAVAISPDGSLIASGGGDGTIRLSAARGGAPDRSWKAHTTAILALAFDADGTRIASGARAGEEGSPIRIWNVPDGSKLHELGISPASSTTFVGFAPGGGALVAGGTDRQSRWFDLAEGGESRPIDRHSGDISVVNWSPDGTRVLIGAGDRSGVYAADSLTLVRTLPLLAGVVVAGAWLDTNTVLLVSSDGVIRAIDTRADPAATRVATANHWCFDVDFSPDGHLLAISNAGVVSIADTSSLGIRLTIPLAVARTRQVRFLPDGSALISASTDGTLRILDPEHGTIDAELPSVRSEAFALAVHPSGRYVFGGHADGSGRLWNLETRTVEVDLPRRPTRYNSAAFSPDGSMLAVTGPGTSIDLLDGIRATPIRQLPTTSGPWAVAFDPAGRVLLTGTDRGTVEAFDVQTGEPLGVVQGHRRLIAALAFSRDGRYFATGSDDGEVKLWDGASRRPLVTLFPGALEVPSIVFDPSGRYLAAGTENRVAVVYDLQAMDAYIEGNRAFQSDRAAATVP